jgi:D-xylose transport system permease protein
MQEVVYYTINFLDGSTIGHYRAILANISGLMDVTFLGYGIGLAGARASAIGNEIVGGGEGALFSIAYQLGVPGSLAFLWFYLRLFRELSHYPLYSKSGVQRKMACIAILIGASTSLIISEHLLTFSGSAAIWILVSLSIACMKAESQIYAANLFPRRAFDINSKSIAYV